VIAAASAAAGMSLGTVIEGDSRGSHPGNRRRLGRL
jgi:hypothetical protein